MRATRMRMQEEASGRSEGLAIEAIGALEERAEEAIALARSAEAAAVGIGAAALDAAERAREAAEQARRAAELAERASGGGAASSRPRDAAASSWPGGGGRNGFVEEFGARADRVAERLHRIERLPLSA